MPQIVFITGCSSGIGLASAVLLARNEDRRFIVYGTVLNSIEEEKDFCDAAGELLNDTLFPVIVDVTKPETISAAVAHIMEKHGRVDIVVNNAGINVCKVPEKISEEMLKQLYDVNFFGMFRVTREVLPIMKKQRSGRIISISSVNGISALPYTGVYASAKFAMEGYSEELAVIGRYFNIWVSVVEPGPVSTPLKANMLRLKLGGPDEIRDDPDVHEIDKQLASCWYDEFNWHTCPLQSAEDVAKVVRKAATDEKPHMRYQTSKEAENLARIRYQDPTGDTLIEHQIERIRPYVERETK